MDHKYGFIKAGASVRRVASFSIIATHASHSFILVYEMRLRIQIQNRKALRGVIITRDK